MKQFLRGNWKKQSFENTEFLNALEYFKVADSGTSIWIDQTFWCKKICSFGTRTTQTQEWENSLGPGLVYPHWEMFPNPTTSWRAPIFRIERFFAIFCQLIVCRDHPWEQQHCQQCQRQEQMGSHQGCGVSSQLRWPHPIL